MFLNVCIGHWLAGLCPSNQSECCCLDRCVCVCVHLCVCVCKGRGPDPCVAAVLIKSITTDQISAEATAGPVTLAQSNTADRPQRLRARTHTHTRTITHGH